jgi:hypothetical protein
VRTEVAVIEKIVSFENDGSPIGEVSIFDPSFAEQTRNRHKVGHLDSLHCSILGSGVAEKGKIDDVEYKIVKSIDEMSSVDFVTRAGAGGQALSLVESDKEDEGGEMKKEEKKLEGEMKETEEKVTLSEDEGKSKGESDVGENTETSEGSGSDASDESGDGNDTDPTDSTDNTDDVSESDMTFIPPNQIMSVLSESTLPEPSKVRIATGTYCTEQELDEEIAAEIAYVKAITGSGQPIGEGQTDEEEDKVIPVYTGEDWYNKLRERHGLPVT